MTAADNDSIKSVDDTTTTLTKEEEEARAKTIANPDVVTKYKTAGEITMAAMKKVIEACVPGAAILDVCRLGDKAVLDGCAKVYVKKTKISKGVSFPTCLSINHVACHYSPLPSDEEGGVLSEGDMVKIQLGAQIDGYPAMMAHTIIIGASQDKPITGHAANVLLAAHTASEAALRMLRPGKTNTDITEAIGTIAAAYGCQPVEGMLSNAISQNKLDDTPAIILAPTLEQRKSHPTEEFKDHQVIALDLFMASDPSADATTTTDATTTGCKLKPMDTRTTVYRRLDAAKFNLKMKTSRAIYAEASSNFGTMAFHLRDMADEKKARMGIIECAKHSLVYPYEPLAAKEGTFVAQFLFTVLLTPNGPLRLTGDLFDAAVVGVSTEEGMAKLTEEMRGLLKSSVRSTKKKSKKKTKTTTA